MYYNEIESDFLLFFNLLEEVPSVKKVKIWLPSLTYSFFTTLVVENNKRQNITHVLEFQVNHLKVENHVTKDVARGDAVLSTMFKIRKYRCK